MKIVFICGSLEAGRDGVGDYTRRLAGAMTVSGARIAILAIADRHISGIVEGRQQADGGVELPVMRLPVTLALNSRFELAKKWVDEINPEWISLQFVIFAFDPRGLKLGLGKGLSSLTKGRRLHLMFHELWVGMDRQSPLKHQLWGRAQKLLITSLLKRLKPDIIHTQTGLYQAQLKKMGYEARLLPLISNIPLVANGYPAGSKADEKGTFTFIIFGNIHHGAPVADFAREAMAYGARRGIKILLKILGRGGGEQKLWSSVCNSEGLSATLMGEQSPEVISMEMQKADAGISTTPLAITEKSGSVAAMHEHNLPVICIARDWHPAGMEDFDGPAEVFRYQKGNLEAFMVSVKTFKGFNNGVSVISEVLSKELRAN